MSFAEILTLEAQLLIVIAVGFLMCKIGVLDKHARKKLADLLFFVILPCNVVNSFKQEFTMDLLMQCGVSMLGMVGQEILVIVLGLFVFRMFTKKEQLVMKGGLINSNISFVGIPLATALYGDLGVLYNAMAALPMRIVIWTVIVIMFQRATGLNTGEKNNIVKKIFTTPVILAVFIGVIRLLTQVQFPRFLDSAIGSISSCTSAIALILIGGILGDADLKGLFTKATVYFSLWRLILVPGIVFAAMTYIFHCDPVVTGVLTTMAGCPVGTSMPTIAQKYDCEPELASQMVVSSTIFCVVTVPVMLMIL